PSGDHSSAIARAAAAAARRHTPAPPAGRSSAPAAHPTPPSGPARKAVLDRFDDAAEVVTTVSMPWFWSAIASADPSSSETDRAGRAAVLLAIDSSCADGSGPRRRAARAVEPPIPSRLGTLTR